MKQHEVRAVPPADEPVRLLHLTDFHLFADAAGELRGVNTAASLATVIAAFQASGWSADAALATGDLIQDDSRAAYGRCRRSLDSLQLPVYLSPGNHDVRELMVEELDRPSLHYCKTLRDRDWSVISIDSCLDGRAGGHVSSSELKRLEQELSASNAKHVLVCLHHPPVALGSRWLDSVGLDDAEGFLDVVRAAGNVRAVLFGHAHQEFDSIRDGIRLLCTPSTCRQFKPGSDEFAVDDLPAAYRTLELQTDGTIETDIHWVTHA